MPDAEQTPEGPRDLRSRLPEAWRNPTPRNPTRIPALLQVIEAVWKRYPDRSADEGGFVSPEMNVVIRNSYEDAVGRWAIKKAKYESADWAASWDRCEPVVRMEEAYSYSSWTDEPSVYEIQVTYFKDGARVGHLSVDCKWDWDGKNFGAILREILDA